MTPSRDAPATRMRRIAVEEAYVIPEMVQEIRKLLAVQGEKTLDMATMLANMSETPSALGKMAFERLLDFDDMRIAAMDAHGVDMQVLSLTTPGVQMFDADTALRVAIASNDTLASVIARNPDRFAGLATIVPQAPISAAREMERAINTLGLNGFIVNSHTNGEYLDHPKYWPILEAAEALGGCIYIHPRCPPRGMSSALTDYAPFMQMTGWGYQMEVATHAIRLIVSGVLDRFPKLKFCLGHMGEGVHFMLSRTDHMMSLFQSWGDTPKTELKASEYFIRNFVISTSGVEDHLALKFSIDRLGADNVLWAIDYPYQPTGPAVAFMDSAPIDEVTRAKVYAGNAERVFNIPPAPPVANVN